MDSRIPLEKLPERLQIIMCPTDTLVLWGQVSPKTEQAKEQLKNVYERLSDNRVDPVDRDDHSEFPFDELNRMVLAQLTDPLFHGLKFYIPSINIDTIGADLLVPKRKIFGMPKFPSHGYTPNHGYVATKLDNESYDHTHYFETSDKGINFFNEQGRNTSPLGEFVTISPRS